MPACDADASTVLTACTWSAGIVAGAVSSQRSVIESRVSPSARIVGKNQPALAASMLASSLIPTVRPACAAASSASARPHAASSATNDRIDSLLGRASVELDGPSSLTGPATIFKGKELAPRARSRSSRVAKPAWGAGWSAELRLRTHRFVPLVAMLVTATAATTAGATPPKAPTSPTLEAKHAQVAAKRAQAHHVLAQIDAIDSRLSVVTEQFDGARVRLQRVRVELRVAQGALSRARVQNRKAQLNEARLLVSLYTTGRPTALEVLLGANSISDLLQLTDAENAISKEVTSVADAATQAKRRLAAQVRAVQAVRRDAEQTVRELASRRAQIERGLAQRRSLLVSVQAQVSRLEAQQRAIQERLAAEARARLAAEAAARARAEAAAAARARAAALRQAQAAAAAATAAQQQRQAQAAASATTTTAATTTTTAVTTTTASLTQPTPSDAAIPPPVTAGHPEAAQIALQYIGVPYLWGGASPSGFDCSGLVSYVFAQLGIALPHYAAAQYTYGVPVPFDDLQPGDLVFFNGLDHVGIYIGAGQYVDAPDTGSFVRIDSLSDPWAIANYVGARRI